MNETLKTLLERRSIKRYKPQQISDEDLNAVLEAGLYAPSGANHQSALFIVVQDRETLELIASMNAAVMGSKGNPYYGAPTVILVFGDKTKVTPVEDASLALGNMFNAAASLGLGSCWIHRTKQMFETEEGKALLKQWGANGDYIGVGSCILGYADGPAPKAAPRKEGRIVFVK